MIYIKNAIGFDMMNRDDNLQQKQEHDEHQQWLEMQQDLGIYRNFAEDFEQFVECHEKDNERGKV